MAHKQIRITSSINGQSADVNINDLLELTKPELARLFDMVQMFVRDNFELSRLEATAVQEVAATLNRQK